MAGAQQGWRNSGGSSSGGLNYLGTWNATTNTPTITSGVGGASGDYYVVSVAGNTNIDGITDWQVGDWIIFNGTVWQKIDNTDQVISVNGLQGVVVLGLADILGQSNSSGAFNVSMDSGQGITYNEGSGSVLVSLATTSPRTLSLPDKSGVLATTLDTLYGGDGTVGTNRVATVTDTLTWSGGSIIATTTTGANTVNTSTGVSPLTFSVFGDVTQITVGGSFDGFGGYYDAGTEPAFQAQIYDKTTFVENTSVFIGIDDFSGTPRPYSSMYYLGTDGTTYTGFQSDVRGEQLYTQRLGVVVTALTSADRVLFTNPTGYIKATTYANLATQLGVVAPVAITANVIPRGTGTTIQNGTWQNVVNDIYPTTTGSNIGDDTHRIGTIFMSSTFDYSTDLNLTSGGTNYHTFDNVGNINLIKTGSGGIGIGTASVASTRLLINGIGSTNATISLAVRNSVSASKLLIQDDGQYARHSGGTASQLANFGSYLQSTGYDTGIALYTRNGTRVGFSMQHTGTTIGSPIVLDVAFQNGQTGIITAIRANASAVGSTNNYGVNGLGRDGSARSIGVFGQIAGGGTVVASQYVAAINGETAHNLDVISYAGRFLSVSGSPANADTKNKVGIWVRATNNTVASGTSAIAVGAELSTTTSGGGGAGTGNIALLIQAIGANNDGTIVFGASSVSARASFVEVTGDVELIAIGDGFIVKSPDGTAWKFTPDNTGAWSSVSV